MRHCSVVLSTLVALGTAGIAEAANYGTPSEAKAMLERVVVALKSADKERSLVMMTKGEGGFKDRDLYPYCGGPNGMFTAHPTLLGKSLKTIRDKNGKPLGEEVYAVAKEGSFAEITYFWPRPGQDEPVEKVAYVTRVGDQVCAVGYYK